MDSHPSKRNSRALAIIRPTCLKLCAGFDSSDVSLTEPTHLLYAKQQSSSFTCQVILHKQVTPPPAGLSFQLFPAEEEFSLWRITNLRTEKPHGGELCNPAWIPPSPLQFVDSTKLFFFCHFYCFPLGPRCCALTLRVNMSIHTTQKVRTYKTMTSEPVTTQVFSNRSISPMSPRPTVSPVSPASPLQVASVSKLTSVPVSAMNGYESMRYLIPVQQAMPQQPYVLMQQPMMQQHMMQPMMQQTMVQPMMQPMYVQTLPRVRNNSNHETQIIFQHQQQQQQQHFFSQVRPLSSSTSKERIAYYNA